MSDTNCNYGGGNCGPTVTTTPTTITSVGVPVHHDSGLPFTGGDVVGLSLIGVGAIVVGSFLARTRRRVLS